MFGFEERVKALRYRLLSSDLRDAPTAMRDCAAHMLLYLDRPEYVQRVALRHLLLRLGAQRADIGFGAPDDATYTVTSVEVDSHDEWKGADHHPVPNGHPAVQVVWRAKGAVFLDARRDPILGSLRDDLLKRGIRSKLARRLSFGERLFGMVCVDSAEEREDWNGEECAAYLEMFVAEFLSPVLWESLVLARSSDSASLTKAEISVARLVAAGMSYKQVGRELGKSPNTVDNQLRSIRAKLGVGNRVELVRACAVWL